MGSRGCLRAPAQQYITLIMAKRIESYDTFEESEEATRRMYMAMSPEERWIKMHELSEGVKAEADEGVFCLYPPGATTQKDHARKSSSFSQGCFKGI